MNLPDPQVNSNSTALISDTHIFLKHNFYLDR